jgi:predicted ATPase
MITSIKFKTFLDRIKIKTSEIPVYPGTIWIGSNGIGKSTLLKMIQTNSSHLDFTFDNENPLSLIYFDSNKMNPNTTTRKVETLAELASIKNSKGQVFQAVYNHLHSVSNTLILIDEPESGLDIDYILKFSEIIGEGLNRNNQYIITSHHPILITQLVNNYGFKVFDFDESNYINYEEYLNRKLNKTKVDTCK